VLGATGLWFCGGERRCHDQHFVSSRLSIVVQYSFRATISVIRRAPLVIVISNSTSGSRGFRLGYGLAARANQLDGRM